ncbi:MAG: HD domain-containing protein [Paracoccaceae bacterium]
MEADKLKAISRATTLADASRPENSAEHSWHICLFALTLAEFAEPGVDINRVIRMLLLHDIVEIDAGDHPIHLAFDANQVAIEEAAAAERLFGLLPANQSTEFRALWDEFEDAQSPDAVFAKAIDRLAPVLQNLHSGGASWRQYRPTLDQIEARVGVKVTRGAPKLWAHIKPQVEEFFRANGLG